MVEEVLEISSEIPAIVMSAFVRKLHNHTHYDGPN